ncbi:hypothetical protein [Streptomyces mayteni]
MQITGVIERILIRAAAHPEHQVHSHNGPALMAMAEAGLLERGALTKKGLAAAEDIAAIRAAS